RCVGGLEPLVDQGPGRSSVKALDQASRRIPLADSSPGVASALEGTGPCAGQDACVNDRGLDRVDCQRADRRVNKNGPAGASIPAQNQPLGSARINGRRMRAAQLERQDIARLEPIAHQTPGRSSILALVGAARMTGVPASKTSIND